jgi:hypothetical protein
MTFSKFWVRTNAMEVPKAPPARTNAILCFIGLVSLKRDQTFNTGHRFIDFDHFVGGLHQFPCGDRDIVAFSGRFLSDGKFVPIEMGENPIFIFKLHNEFELIVVGPLIGFVE